jgi:hypothetical protein
LANSGAAHVQRLRANSRGDRVVIGFVRAKVFAETSVKRKKTGSPGIHNSMWYLTNHNLSLNRFTQLEPKQYAREQVVVSSISRLLLRAAPRQNGFALTLRERRCIEAGRQLFQSLRYSL